MYNMFLCVCVCDVMQYTSETRTGADAEGVQVHPSVSKLVEYVWREASGQLEEVLAVPVDSIKAEQLDKAEAALLTIRRLLQEAEGGSKQG